MKTMSDSAATYRDLLADQYRDTSRWRLGKAQQFPGDHRNNRSAAALADAVDYVAGLQAPHENPALEAFAQFEAELNRFDGPHSAELVLSHCGHAASRFFFENEGQLPTRTDFDALLRASFQECLEAWGDYIEEATQPPPAELVALFEDYGRPLWGDDDNDEAPSTLLPARPAIEVWDRIGEIEISGERVTAVSVLRDVDAGRVWYHLLPIPDIAIGPGKPAPFWQTHEGRLADFIVDANFDPELPERTINYRGRSYAIEDGILRASWLRLKDLGEAGDAAATELADRVEALRTGRIRALQLMPSGTEPKALRDAIRPTSPPSGQLNPRFAQLRDAIEAALR
jgi:hypothetical protein